VGLDFWANISVVWLSLLCFVGMLIPLVAAFFAIRGMHIAIGKSRTAMGTAQKYSSVIRNRTESVSQRIAEPVVQTGSHAAKVDKVIRSLTDDVRS
jgi:hypothetical protein